MMNGERVDGFITAYGPKMEVTIETGTVGAKQSFKDECDINRIMAKYQKTGALSWLSRNEGRYEDVSGFEFQSAMNVVASANEMFADLPSSIRKRFGNDPAEFLAFMGDPENAPEMIRLGLATAHAPEVVAADPAAAPAVPVVP